MTDMCRKFWNDYPNIAIAPETSNAHPLELDPKRLTSRQSQCEVNVDKFWVFIKIESIDPTNVKSLRVKKKLAGFFTKDLVRIVC